MENKKTIIAISVILILSVGIYLYSKANKKKIAKKVADELASKSQNDKYLSMKATVIEVLQTAGLYEWKRDIDITKFRNTVTGDLLTFDEMCLIYDLMLASKQQYIGIKANTQIWNDAVIVFKKYNVYIHEDKPLDGIYTTVHLTPNT